MSSGDSHLEDLEDLAEDLSRGEVLAPMTPEELLLSPNYRPEIETPGLRCKACRHPQTDVIDQHLIAQDLTLEQISQVYGISTSALSRHKKDCIIGMVFKGREIMRQQQAAKKLVSTMDKVDEVYDIGMGLLKHAAEEKNIGDSLALMGKLEDNLRLRGEIGGEVVGPNGPKPGMGGGDGSGQGGMGGGKVQVIVLPTTYGRPAEEIAKLIEATPLVLLGSEADGTDDGERVEGERAGSASGAPGNTK